MFGVTIVAKTGWDEISCNPTVSIKDPLCWLPDPNFDPVNPARFHYFEEYLDKECIDEEYGFEDDAYENISAI